MRRTALVLALALFATTLAAQPPIRNAQITAARASGDLASQVRSAGTTWVAYAVPSASPGTLICCSDGAWNSWRTATCKLDNGSQGFTINTPDRDGELTVDSQLVVFYRLAEGRIERVRVFSTNCAIDAHGASITWLEGVNPRQSVALLASLITEDGERSSKRALDALALHADSSAADQLEAIVRSSRPNELRGHAIFWLGNVHGRRGYLFVKNIATNRDEPVKIREKAVFAMTQSEQPERIDDLIAIARNDPESKVRQHALFWLSQAAGKKAAAALRSAVDHDPDTDVKKKAVFGIAQLPDDESIPLLADLLRTHKNPEVRKQAAFWLGQKKDPRALRVIEEILRN